MMTWRECKSLIVQDLTRCVEGRKTITLIRYLITNSSFKICFWFRIGTYLQKKNLGLFYFFVYWHYKQLMYKTGIQLPIGTKVGGGLRFNHFGNIVVNKNATIGKNATIYNGVTIGVNLNPDEKEVPPVIGDNVVLCAGAKVIGDVRIGNGSVIGANAVVVKDIQEDSVAVGVPAKRISNRGFEYVELYIKHK